MGTFISTDSANAETTSWFTPKWIVERLGEFDLDPCGSPKHKIANIIFHYPEQNGLHEPWFGRVWLNPPYGKECHAWIRKLARHGNGIALIFARTDAEWFQNTAGLFDGVFFLKGRISFLRADIMSETNPAGAPSCFFIAGQENLKYFEKFQGQMVKFPPPTPNNQLDLGLD